LDAHGPATILKPRLAQFLHARSIAIMQLLETLAVAFFNVFGITQPSDATRRRAAWFLFVMLLLVAAGLTAAGMTIYHLMHI
jgi:hypothetical protein